MIELMQAVGSWWSLLLVVLVFGFAPGFVLGLVVRFYPVDHVRRRELLAEYYGVPRLMRPVWVAEQLGLVLWEGPCARWRAWRSRLSSGNGRDVAAPVPASASSGELAEVIAEDPKDIQRLLLLWQSNPGAGVISVENVGEGALSFTLDFSQLPDDRLTRGPDCCADRCDRPLDEPPPDAQQ